MKKLLAVFILGFFFSQVIAQTVENIRVEQDGDLLNIHYRIGNSTDNELYIVTLTCSMDGGAVFKPVSVDGDVGENIRGGRSRYTIVWDVFKDVDEIGDVEFFVRVDLMGDQPGKQENAYAFLKRTDMERTISVGYSGAFSSEVQHLIGLNLSTLGNWGGYFSIRTGGYDSAWGGYLLSITAGATKYITTQDRLRLHAYSGVGIGDYADSFEFDAGMIAVIAERIDLSLGIAITPYFVEPVFGIGIVF